ncbi:MAG TPA: MFS transporter, partial [Ktedonobacteraceae bacterium]|nr:MFS transporter [Ktedonobacteraceae bacterium]
FVWQERRTAEPIMPLWVFSRRVLVGSNLATLALGLLSIGLTTFLPTYAQGVLGVSAIIAGFALAVMSVSWPVCSALSGRFYMRIGFRNTALIGAAISLLSGIFFTLLPESTNIFIVSLGSLIMGAGLGLLSTPLIVGLQSVVGWNRRGVVTGSNMFARQLGQTVGAAIFGSIANAVLVGWLAQAPKSIAKQLPTSLNTASQYLGGGSSSALPARAEAYLRLGLYQASHQVFLVLAIIGLASVMVLVFTPRTFRTLHFAEDDQATNLATEPQDVLVSGERSVMQD